MSWQEVKRLREVRGTKVAAAKVILTNAQTEKRELTPDEVKTFDAFEGEVRSIDADIDRLDRFGRMDAGGDTRSGPGREPWEPDHATRTIEDAAQTRALPKDETCRQFIESRNLNLRADPGIGLGAFFRSILVGPKTDLERRALSESSLGAGGYTTNPHLGAEWAESLRSAAVVAAAGARVVPMMADRHYVARVATPPSASWIAELDDVPESTAAFDRIELVARDIVCYVKVSRQLLMDSVNVEQILEAEMTRAVALEIDRVAMFGTGASNMPTGVYNSTGISTVSMGTNGGALTSYAKLLDAQYEVANDNAGEVNAAILHPRTARTLNGLADTTGQPLNRPEALKGVRFLQTTAVPINQTQGTATNASAIIAGDWSRLVIGIHLEPRIEVTPTPLLNDKLQVGLICWGRIDCVAERPQAFAKIIGVTP